MMTETNGTPPAPRPAYCIPGLFQMSQDVPLGAEFLELLDEPALPAAKLFDDFYFFGTKFVGCMMRATDEGILMIDAMNRPADFENIILPGMLREGLDPADIKKLIVTHGHVDHYGCARMLQERYGCQVYMSRTDYDFMKRRPLDFGPGVTLVQGEAAAPERVEFIAEGDRVTLGDATVEVCFTPGHTPGGLSLILPVHDDGETHLVGIWGGTQIPDVRQDAEAYLRSILHFMEACESRGVDVSVQSHAFSDWNMQKGMYHGAVAQYKAAGLKNPMILGRRRFMLFLDCIRLCAEAKLDSIK